MKSVEGTALLIDFGSTFTKLTAVDLNKGKIIGKSMSPTTISDNIMVGMNVALEALKTETGIRNYETKLASSSAAGGLKMFALGLVPELTLEAAKSAALGAGANLMGTFSYELSSEDLIGIEAADPDIILLCGGTDGGNKDVVLHNADVLSRAAIRAPIIYAGNRSAAEKSRTLLEAGKKEVIVTENVMPKLGELNVEKVRSAIRSIFIKRIVKSKGLSKAEKFVDSVLMPTPAAVLKAAVLIAEGYEGAGGLGDLLVVDVGGATTDVHSVGSGSVLSGAVSKGVPEPYAKRTVEGDLGVRYNARSILTAVGREGLISYLGLRIKNLANIVENISTFPDRLPRNTDEQNTDTVLACAAVDLAMERHAGVVETLHMPFGDIPVQRGKNLMPVKTLIGTGGPIIRTSAPRFILEKACFRQDRAFSLKPRDPNILFDEQYALYAIGLLSEIAPQKALDIAEKYLKEVPDCGKAPN
jgi:uncharacterized protein (TIGR01319 family)